MSAGTFSLLALTIGFFALVWWVYTPSRRKRLESYGRIPLDGEPGADVRTTDVTKNTANNSNNNRKHGGEHE